MKLHIPLTAAAALLLPLSTHAAVLLSIPDTIAGMRTEIRVEGLAPSARATVMVEPPFGAQVAVPITANQSGVGTATLSGEETEIAGTYAAELTEAQTSATTTFRVLPEALDPTASSLQAERATVEPDGEDAVTVSVILRDRLGNALSGRPVELIPSRTADTATPLNSETDGDGQQDFLVSTWQEGTIALRAMDLLSGTLLPSELQLNASTGRGGYYDTYTTMPMPTRTAVATPYAPTTVSRTQGTTLYRGSRMVGSVLPGNFYGQAVNYDVTDSFVIEVKEQLLVNEDATLRITAIDQYGKRVESYAGTVLLSSTDPMAILPLSGEIQFYPQNLGEKVLTLGLRFRTPGQHILYVEDGTDPNINAQVMIEVVGDGTTTTHTISVTSLEEKSTVGSPELIVEGEGPPFINLVVTGGKEDEYGDTNQEGEFAIPVELDSERTEHTLRVRGAENPLFDSGDIHITLDTQDPEVGMITFDPLNPQEEDTVHVTVETEPQLASVTLTIENEELILTEGTPGTYALDMAAPAAGTHQPIIRATDAAGNTTEVRNNIVVTKRSLPKVENVTAESRASAVSLRWDPVTSERVDAYRIYVGETSENYLYTLDTDRATAIATVAGLESGKIYTFAVTALQGDRESGEKSDPVQASALGLALTITEQDGALLIEWGVLASGTPLSSYLLEYGVESDLYTEKRTLSGDLQAYTLRDLINGITYSLRLTPVATTGNVLTDQAAKGSGTPQGAGGFHPSSSTPAPSSIGTPASAFPPIGGNLHGGAPGLSQEGIPLSVWWTALGAAALFLFARWHRRRTMKLTLQFLEEMQSRYRA
ncbi:hypothetical protein COU80_02460 [Candidatus Peregrinibacteria bacterium CG10_big_fil_rev_8_21_14_0_10_55_24]|nr:MAG: hypothetical protein COU80_02460 [Candidatus Peregrinibacteria bacterium CG10_big_fil_rev_8_21_14_0_10_55_24]